VAVVKPPELAASKVAGLNETAPAAVQKHGIWFIG
jgi:hypothetical protein